MILRTRRLLLREYTMGDVAAVLRYQRHRRYVRFHAADVVDEAHVRALLQLFVAWRGEVPRARHQLAVTLATSGEVIGSVGLRRDDPESPVAELGYELSPDQWGRGYATEAARALLDFGFGTTGLHRAHARCLAANAGSARVLERLGMRLEGRLRHHQRFKGRWWDVLLYGMLAHL